MENKEILDLIYKMFPNPHCELEYFDDFSFLCAVVLSAQTTDKAVNLVTKPLFLKYPTVFDIASSSEDELIPILRPIGLMKNKSHYLIKISKAIVEDYGGKVPHDFDELIKLPGVGRKTANVFLAEIDKRPAIAVDTHVNRVSYRLGLSSSIDNVLKTEHELEAGFDEKDWIKVHYGLLFMGRYKCLSKNPKCSDCNLKSICRYEKRD
ncbi:MAG: endonuclease III [Clostridium sp. CAG:307_30_263]|nr:MAG: endonuclease III [Clostridium sp. CAG:307_30_263]